MATHRFRQLRESARTRFGLLSGLLFAFIYLYLVLFVPPRTPIHTGFDDDKLFLYSARRILRGQMVYRDFFELYFPGTDLFYASTIWLFGSRAWLPNACLLGLGIAFVWTSIVLSRKLVTGASVFLPGLLFLWISFRSYLDASPHWYGNLFIMIATAVLAEKRSRMRLALAGGLTGLAICFSQHHGVFAAAGLAAFVLWEDHSDGGAWRQIARRELHFLVPCTAIIAAFNGYIVFEVGLREFVYSTVVFPFTYWGYGQNNGWSENIVFEIARAALGHDLHLFRALIVAILVPGVYIVALAGYMRRTTSPPSEPWRRIVLISAVGLAMFASVLSSASYWRLAVGSLPALVVLVWLLDQKIGVKATYALWIVTIFMTLKDIAVAQKNWKSYLDSPSGRIALYSSDPEPLYEWLGRNTRPGEYVFEATDGYLYFWFGLENPTKVWFLTACDFTRPEQVTDAVADLEQRQTRLILWHGSLDEGMCPPISDHIQPMREYVHLHYRRIKTFKGTEDSVWERTEANRK